VAKDIKFPMSLDVFDLCTPELQQRLTPARDRFKAEEDKRVEIAQTVKPSLVRHLNNGSFLLSCAQYGLRD